MSLALILVAAQPCLVPCSRGRVTIDALRGRGAQGCPLLIALEKQCKSRNEIEQKKPQKRELGC